MFPSYIESLDNALYYLADLATFLGGEQLDGIEFIDQPGGVDVAPFNIELPGGYQLAVAMTLDANLTAGYYKFNLSRGSQLVWRHDNHAGREAAHGGRTHLHVGPRPDVRRPHAPIGGDRARTRDTPRRVLRAVDAPGTRDA